MDRKQKITNLLKLKVAKDKGEDCFVIGNRLDDLEDKIENIKPTDLTRVEDRLGNIEKELENLGIKLDEEIEINLEIV